MTDTKYFRKMIEDAITTLVKLLDQFPEAHKIEVIEQNHIVLHWYDKAFRQKDFISTIEMLEWMEKNLKSK